jgi:nucleoside-diphosphate-sugar epimerase
VVFGAAGAIGSAIVRQLAARGEFVRAVARDPEEARAILPESAAVVAGDAFDLESAKLACRGAGVVYDCINVRYSKWTEQIPTIRSNVLAAAREAGARLVYTDNVYAYGPLQQIPATEEHPRDAATRKGKLRAETELMLLDAHQRGEVMVVIPRFPDFYGPYVVNALVRPMFEAAVTGKTATWPASLDVEHDLVYIDDAADAAVRLAMDDDSYGQVWHVPGPGPITGRRFLETAFAAAGSKPKMRAVSRGLFKMAGIFIPDAGEMVEMLYQFERPLVLSGRKFARAFPDFRYTSHEEGIKQTAEWFKEMIG